MHGVGSDSEDWNHNQAANTLILTLKHDAIMIMIILLVATVIRSLPIRLAMPHESDDFLLADEVRDYHV